MDGGQENKPSNAVGQAPQTQSSDLQAGKQFNQEMINGVSQTPPSLSPKPQLKRLLAILGGLAILSLLSVVVYYMFLKPEPPTPPPPPEPKPVTTSVEIKADEELYSLQYGVDYGIEVSGKNYLVEVYKSPKRVIYNGKEVYRGEDLKGAILSANGQHWATETVRDEQRTKRDENTKILQTTTVQVSTITIDGTKWGEKDNANLIGLNDGAVPEYLIRTGKQTPSQYGDALNEEVVYNGETERLKTSYGVVSYGSSADGNSWYATTNNPSTKEVFDFFVNGSKKDSLDARILSRVSIDKDGNYLLAFCKEQTVSIGVGNIGKDCQISVNGNTRTTISGTVHLARVLGTGETYAGLDKELRQSFIKNKREDLNLEHRKDLDEDQNTTLEVYLNESANKFAIVTSRKIDEKIRINLTINSQIIENKIEEASLFAFGTGEDATTLFIYDIPDPKDLEDESL